MVLGLTLKGVKMAYVPKVWVLIETIDPYDLQWGNRTESMIKGVFSTFKNAKEELDICRKDLEKIDEKTEARVYGDYKDGTHVLFEISEHIIDYVG